MPLTIWVYGAASEEFSVLAPDGCDVQAVKRSIWADPLTTGNWAVFLADAAGTKPEGAAALKPRDAFPAAPGSTMNVWVERVVAPAAGETWGPC